MLLKMVTIKFQGRDIEVESIPISESDENWSAFTLEDGSIIKTKSIVTRAFRAVDEKTEIGEPLYITQSTNIISTEINPDLMEGED